MEPFNEQRPPFPDYYVYLHQKKAERRALRLLGFYIGSAILLFIALQSLLTLPLAFPGLREKYQNDGLFQNGVDLLVVTASMLLPFMGLSRSMRGVSGCTEPLPLERPRGGADVLLTVPAGLMFCMAANYITDLLVMWFGGFGVELSAPEIPLPTGVLGVLSAVFRVVVMPALVEEMCFRGVVMQHLRRFGDRYAVVASALCFGLLHCNLIQMPFAFIAGLVMGFFVIRTGSLWPAIVIHALNNSVSLVFSYLNTLLSEPAAHLAYIMTEGTLFGCGAVCFLVYLYRSEKTAGPKNTATAYNSFGEKFAVFFLSPTMLLSVCAMLYFTSRYVGLT